MRNLGHTLFGKSTLTINDLMIKDRINGNVKMIYVGETTDELTKNKTYNSIFVNKSPDEDSYIIFDDDNDHLNRVYLTEKNKNLFLTKQQLRKLKLDQLQKNI